MGESSRVSRHYGCQIRKSITLFKVTYLMGDVGPRIANVTAHLPHDSNVFVAVEEREFVFSAGAPAGSVRGAVRFEAGITEHDYKPLCVFVC